MVTAFPCRAVAFPYRAVASPLMVTAFPCRAVAFPYRAVACPSWAAAERKLKANLFGCEVIGITFKRAVARTKLVRASRSVATTASTTSETAAKPWVKQHFARGQQFKDRVRIQT
jgi:hypothetical protein